MAGEQSSVFPAWEARVLFRHSFETAIETPEQTLAPVNIQQAGGALTAEGFLGKGFKVADFSDKKAKPLRIISEALSPDKPLTLMLWWRLDEEVPEDGGYQILHLGHPGKPGYISNCVRGKGQWCALKQPTWVYQVHNFPGISHVNDPYRGRAATQAGVWHHTALTVVNAREVSWYQDGQFAFATITKGRDLLAGELSLLELGGAFQRRPMTLDDVLVLDRALSATEIADYYAGAIKLHEIDHL